MSDTTTTPSSFAVAAAPPRDEVAAARERQPLVGEEWLAVLVGAALIALVLVGVRPAMPRFAWGTPETPAAQLIASDNIARTVQTVLLVLGPVIAGAAVLRANMPAFVPGALALYVLGWLAQAMGGHVAAAGWGLEYVIFALAIGLVINHTVGVPNWLREGLRTEYYIKTGLVVLGATILFDEIVGAGMLGPIETGAAEPLDESRSP